MHKSAVDVTTYTRGRSVLEAVVWKMSRVEELSGGRANSPDP